MHSNFVNGHKLLCYYAHTVLEKYMGTEALFVILNIVLLRFLYLSLLTVLFPFLGSSIVCVHNNLKRIADLVL